MDLRNSRRLLSETGGFHSHRFSSDGGLFAAFLKGAGAIHVWKYASGCYTTWRELPCQDPYGPYHPLLFSPNSSFILGHFNDILRVWRLSDHHSTPPDDRQQLGVISHDGTYIATANEGHCTITITNHVLPTPTQFIDVDTEIQALVLTGNILLAVCPKTIVAWHLTEEGAVSGVLGRWRADQSDGVWTLPRSLGYTLKPIFAVEGQIGGIWHNFHNPHVYHTGTGKVLQPVRVPSSTGDDWYDLKDARKSPPRLQYRSLDEDIGVCSEDSGLNTDPSDRSEGEWPVSGTTVREGWVKDPERKHRLWLPFEWRAYSDWDWFSDVTTLQLKPPGGEPKIIIMF